MEGPLEKENKLLLLCSRTVVNVVEREKISVLAGSGINWNALFKMAIHHKTWPLLYKNISSICPQAPPAEFLKKLKQHYSYNSLRNVERLRLLYEIDRLFAENNIDFLTVKGPLLTLQYFGDIAYRSFCDLDILVRKKDLQKATELICSLGFDFLPDGLPEKYYYWFAKMNHHSNLGDGKGLHVEVHWELSGHYRGLLWQYEELEPFIEKVELPGGRLVQTLNKEMMLLYLCLHGQRDYWQKYDSCSCIFELMRYSPSIDYAFVAALATRFHLREVLLLARCLTGKLFEHNFDKTILEKEKEFSECWLQTEIYFSNYNVVNSVSVRCDGQRFGKIIPQEVKVLGSHWGYGRVVQVLRNYFIPQIVDWKRKPIDYRLRFLYFLLKPFFWKTKQIKNKKLVNSLLQSGRPQITSP